MARSGKNDKNMVDDAEDPTSDLGDAEDDNTIDSSDENSSKIDEFDDDASYNEEHGIDSACKKNDNAPSSSFPSSSGGTGKAASPLPQFDAHTEVKELFDY